MKPLLVAIHDVAPPHAVAVDRLWRLCRACGSTPALFIVPDWHGTAPFESHPEFVAWLRARADEGAELILHGERHDETGRRRTLLDRLRATGRTAREAECLTLDRAALTDLIARGTRRLAALGLFVTGFVPPAWLMRANAREAVFASGLRFTEDAWGVYLARRAIPAPAVRWSTRSPWRARASVAVATLRSTWQADASLLRLALHPTDLVDVAVVHSVEQTLRSWCGIRQPTSYAAITA